MIYHSTRKQDLMIKASAQLDQNYGTTCRCI